jgi:hypothetical protein
VDYFLQSQPLFPQGDKFRLGCVHERKWDVKGEGKTEGGAQWYHGCGVGCQLWHAPMAFHGFSKSIYLCTCHNLSTVVRQADIFNTFHICNGIWFKTYDSEMQKYCAIFHTHSSTYISNQKQFLNSIQSTATCEVASNPKNKVINLTLSVTVLLIFVIRV